MSENILYKMFTVEGAASVIVFQVEVRYEVSKDDVERIPERLGVGPDDLVT